MTADKAEGIVIIGAALIAAYAVYKAASAASAVGNKAVNLVTGAADAVGDVASGVVNVVKNTYGEVNGFLSRSQYYSPAALDASMSRADAIKLSDEMALRYTAQDRLSDLNTPTTDNVVISDSQIQWGY